MLRQSRDEHRRRRRQARIELPVTPWGFSIEPSSPLRFKETEADGLRVRIDLFLKSYWNAEPAEAPCRLTSTIRLWALDVPVYFRSDWDAVRLYNEIVPANGRVMLRTHFDLANEGQPGPKFHLQIGGVQHSGEFSWFPESMSVPRFVHYPMDLVLAIELIAATFFEDKYRRIRREPAWINSRRTSEQHLVKRYLSDALNAISSEDSVLEALWNRNLE